MSRYIFCILLFLMSQFCHAAEWKWEPRARNDGVVIILASSKGFDSIVEAVDSIPKESWIKQIKLAVLSQYPQLQDELHSYMEEKDPKKLKGALGSAGNIHNPQVTALHDTFREGLLQSRFVRTFNEAFSNRCEEISSASFEKFFIIKNGDKPKYEAMVWLTTQRCDQ